jgi:hypothetical protein
VAIIFWVEFLRRDAKSAAPDSVVKEWLKKKSSLSEFDHLLAKIVQHQPSEKANAFAAVPASQRQNAL